MDLNDAEQIIACRWLWGYLERKHFDMSAQILGRITIEAELLDVKTEICYDSIINYLSEKIPECR